MTDDPEITDPRDPHKRRDIVAELDWNGRRTPSAPRFLPSRPLR